MSEKVPEKIGIIGGGINSALLCLEAKRKGLCTTIVDSDMYCPAATYADEHLLVPLNKNSLSKLIQRTDVIVFASRLESIDDYAPLEAGNIPVYPQLDVLETLHSRQSFLEKMEEGKVAVAKYKKLNSEIEVMEHLKNAELPISITKYYKNELEYNESDEIVVLSDEDVVDLLIDKDKQVDYWLAEEMQLETIELSVAVTRDKRKKMYTYSVSQDTYDGDEWRQGRIPARITKTLQNKAIALAKRAVRTLGGIGTFTVNVSVNKGKELYVKDVQPYALANGIYTSESCNISQYDHLIRMVLGLQLFPAESNGVLFSHLEKGSKLSNFENMGSILERLGTNVHVFKGRTRDDTKFLYTFKADSWDDLENNLEM